MKRQVLIVLLIPVLALTLTGCLRQAAEPFQPVSLEDTSPAALPTDDSPIQVVEPTPTPDASIQSVETPSDTVPTEDVPPTDSGPDPIIVTVAPSETPTTEVIVVETSDPGTGEDGQPVASATFITPNSPLDPPIVDTPIPTFTPTIEGLDPLQPTPTDPFDSQNGTNTDDDCLYTVVSGDTLYRIALANDTSVSALREANPDLQGDTIFPGDTLNLPDCGDNIVRAPTNTPEPEITTQPGQRIHTVASGETLFIIAQRYGITVQDIVNANNLTNPNRISPGQQLIIPGDE